MKLPSLKTHFNLRSLKTKGLTLLIEHLPCCILSVAAGFIGLPLLNHNPVIELGFAIGGAITGEYVGHKYFLKHKHPETTMHQFRRYGLSLLFGLASWGLHQKLFHHHHDEDHHHKEHHDHAQYRQIAKPDISRTVLFTA